jgi:CDP-glycerol glycerophosphotransferase
MSKLKVTQVRSAVDRGARQRGTIRALGFRRVGQTVVQTWHGVGLKRIGLDIERVRFANKSYLDNIRIEADNTDFVVSPNPFTSPILRRAFAVKGELLETGAPRNDIFYAPDIEQRRARVRQRLGLGTTGSRIILYAPTWRDHVHHRGRYRLDLHVDLVWLASELGDGYAVLFRKHSNIVDNLPPQMSRAVLDVSDYPDIQELLLVADVLITDYSTLMFDFANTGRPMIFYTYDLEHYRETLRGFYIDFENEVPGPLVWSEAEVIDAVRASNTLMTQYARPYEQFVELYCCWDDGLATKRVVHELLEDL